MKHYATDSQNLIHMRFCFTGTCVQGRVQRKTDSMPCIGYAEADDLQNFLCLVTAQCLVFEARNHQIKQLLHAAKFCCFCGR